MPRLFTKTLAGLAVAGLVLSLPQVSGPGEAAGVSKKYRKAGSKPLVRGSSKRVGGYSYSYADSIIDFRDRSIFIDPSITAETRGPFDSGFFFESGIERQNNSPYLY